MTNFKLLAIGGITAYLLYINMQKNVVEPPEHIKVSLSDEQRVDITTEKEPVKENIPIVADERPKPPKPIAIPIPDSTVVNDYKYHPIHGWIDWDLMHNYKQPIFKTFQTKTYM